MELETRVVQSSPRSPQLTVAEADEEEKVDCTSDVDIADEDVKDGGADVCEAIVEVCVNVIVDVLHAPTNPANPRRPQSIEVEVD